MFDDRNTVSPSALSVSRVFFGSLENTQKSSGEIVNPPVNPQLSTFCPYTLNRLYLCHVLDLLYHVRLHKFEKRFCGWVRIKVKSSGEIGERFKPVEERSGRW